MSVITSLTAENIKRIKAVRVTPTGATVVIGGNNAQGKSSVLDAIAYALAGKDSIPTEPIRRGEKSANVVLETEDLVIKRKFTPSGSTLEVTNKEGLKFPSPQAVLDKLCSKIAFDPLRFTQLGETPDGRRQQLKQIQDLVGVNTTELDASRKLLFDQRTELNRAIKTKQAEASILPLTGPEPVSVQGLLDKLKEAEAHNGKIRTLIQSADLKKIELNTRLQASETAKNRVKELQLKLVDARKYADDLLANHAQAEKDATEAAHVSSAEIPVETSTIRQQIADAEKVNREANLVVARKDADAAISTHVMRADKMTVDLDAIDAKRTALIASAKFPVSGLGMGDDGPTFNGLPLDQASDAEKLRVGLSIACAMNPNLKVMLIRNASLLDQSSLALVEKIATENGAQVWLERVGNDGHCTVVIEDGEVA